MIIVQRFSLVLLDREVEDCRSLLHEWNQVGVVAIVGGDELSPPKTKLWGTTARNENGAVVDRDGDSLL